MSTVGNVQPPSAMQPGFYPYSSLGKKGGSHGSASHAPQESENEFQINRQAYDKKNVIPFLYAKYSYKADEKKHNEKASLPFDSGNAVESFFNQYGIQADTRLKSLKSLFSTLDAIVTSNVIPSKEIGRALTETVAIWTFPKALLEVCNLYKSTVRFLKDLRSVTGKEEKFETTAKKVAKVAGTFVKALMKAYKEIAALAVYMAKLSIVHITKATMRTLDISRLCIELITTTLVFVKIIPAAIKCNLAINKLKKEYPAEYQLARNLPGLHKSDTRTRQIQALRLNLKEKLSFIALQVAKCLITVFGTFAKYSILAIPPLAFIIDGFVLSLSGFCLHYYSSCKKSTSDWVIKNGNEEISYNLQDDVTLGEKLAKGEKIA